MKHFEVEVTGLHKIHDMPGTWDETEYRALLRELEVDDVDDLAGGDLYEILLMALQDLGEDEAGERVLACKLRKAVSRGVRQNIVEDLLEGSREWEEAADIFLHRDIFAACVLLHAAFPKLYPRPDMLRLELRLRAGSAAGQALLQEPPEAAFVTRVLADGMSEKSILERLFDEQLFGRRFPEAEGIIWLAEYGDLSDDATQATLTIYSSRHWLQAMSEVDTFPSSAYNDSHDDDDEDED